MKEKTTFGNIGIALLRFATLSALSFTSVFLSAQNFVPNPSFEIFTTCPPPETGMGGPLESPPWISAGPGTADYFNACADPMWRGVPYNFQGFQQALSGSAYAGVYTIAANPNYREYINARLVDTLEADVCYKASVWVNYSYFGCSSDQFGILFTSDVPNPVGMNPQIAWAGGFLGDTLEWTEVFGYFTATGNEEYITIGNFRTDAETDLDPECSGSYAYYYIDEVLVEEVTPEGLDIDLNGPVVACDSFVIDPGGEEGIVYVWSTGDQAPTLTVYTSGTYSVTASFNCFEVTAEIDVTILDSIVLDIGPPEAFICEGETYEIELDPDLGPYTWQDGSTGADYTITEAGLYYVTLDYCGLSSDTILMTSAAPPSPFDLGPDMLLCDGDVLTFNFDPSLGDFEWQDNSTDASYTIDSEGTYSLTISNVCGEETDEIEVDVIEIPAISLGPDTYLCDDGVIDYNLDPDLGEYLWQDGSSEPFYSIFTPGVYAVTVSNQCGASSDEILVTPAFSPEIDFGPDLQGCPGDTFILDASGSTGAYTWQDGSETTEYIVTTSGTYSLTITNECGSAIDEVIVVIDPSITPPDLGPDLNMCPGDQVILAVPASGGSVLWNDMSTADTLLVNSGGTYFVQLATPCESYSDTIVITLNNNPPVVQLPADFNLCDGDSINLDAGITGVSYLWNDGTMSSQLMVSSPGVYSLTVSNSCGTSIDSVLVSAGEAAPTVALGADTTMCGGDTIVITPAFTHVHAWTWHDGSSTPEYMVTSPDTVSIEVANTCATAHDSLVTSLLSDAPNLDLGPDIEMCPGESAVLTISIPNVNILWPDGSTGPDYILTDSATVFATISNVCGQNADTVEVSLLPETPALNLGQDQTICPGELVIYDPGITGVSYFWHDGSTNSMYQTTQGELIYLTITGVCGSTTDTVVLTESTDGPQLDLGTDLAACEGETVTIEAGITGVQYLWQDGSILDELVVTQSGVYSLMVSNSCGADTDSIGVVFTPFPPLQALGPDTILCEGLTVLLTANTSPDAMLVWQDMSTTPTFLVSQPGKYYVTAFNQCGDQSDTVEVDFKDAPDPFNIGPDTTICPGQTVLLSSPSIFYDVLWQDGSGMLHLIADHAGRYWLQLSNECGAESDTLQINVHDENPVLQLEPELLWCPGDQFLLDATQDFDATYLWSTGALTPSITVSTPGLYQVEVGSICKTVEDQSEVIPEDNCDMAGDPLFYIPNVFSPNGDDINDEFKVFTDLPANVLSMDGSIYDRWGNLVFGSTENPFTWDGHFGDASMNPGVYVYVVKIRYVTTDGEREEVFSGDVTVVR